MQADPKRCRRPHGRGWLYWTFMCVLIGCGGTPQHRAHAQASKAQRRTVLDYYKLLPASYFDRGRRPALRAGSPGVDIKNDYLHVGWDSGALDMAVFRYAGRALVAVYLPSFDAGGFIDLLRYEKGRWRKVTTALLPLRRNRNHVYVLPRYGTTITVHQSDDGQPGRRLYDLAWRAGRFHLKRI